MKKDRKWEFRTVRHGRVRIGGHEYEPEAHHVPYDGRLDGQRFLFGRYWQCGAYLPFVALWGTEAAAKSLIADHEYGPECVNGSFPWYFWKLVEPPSVDAVDPHASSTGTLTTRDRDSSSFKIGS